MIFAIKIGFLEIGIVDFIDISLVAYLLFQVYKLMRGSVAVRIFLGFLFLYLIFLVVDAIGMELLSAILGQFMGVGVLAAIILFQQEIRKFLLLIGRTSFRRDSMMKNIFKRSNPTAEYNVTAIVEGAKQMGGANTGALMVISRTSELKFFAESGDPIEAVITKRLLLAIFNKTSPLHDGAAILYKGKIKAARCILPVTERDVPAQFGTRHRAALGMSEETDTLVLVVSEETGQISIARNGELTHNLSPLEVRRRINEYLQDKEEIAEEPTVDSGEELISRLEAAT